MRLKASCLPHFALLLVAPNGGEWEEIMKLFLGAVLALAAIGGRGNNPPTLTSIQHIETALITSR